MEQKSLSKRIFKLYVRNTIFGIEDSLVSTVGLLSGIAVAGVPPATIVLSGIVLIFVEALSMAAGSFLSEQSAQEYIDRDITTRRDATIGGGIMFCSYFVSGFIPLAPYIFLEGATAFWLSIAVACGALFFLGAVSARLFHSRIVLSGLRMLIVGGLAIGIGVIIGSIVH